MLNGPFRGTDATATGLVTRHQLARPRFRRIFPDVYVPAGLELSLNALSLAAFEFVRDRGGALGGYSAAVLLGADCAPRNAPAEVVVPLRLQSYAGPRIRRDRLPATDLLERAGVLLTTAERTAWDLARRLRLVEAVVAVDALAHGGAFRPTDLLDRRAANPGFRGCRQLDEVVALADPRAESPPESRLRIGLVLAGQPKPEVQYRVLDERGIVLARADLAYPESLLAIEYDGAGHYERQQGERDRQRDAVLAALGWQTLRLGPDDLQAMSRTVARVERLRTIRRVRPVERQPMPVISWVVSRGQCDTRSELGWRRGEAVEGAS